MMNETASDKASNKNVSMLEEEDAQRSCCVIAYMLMAFCGAIVGFVIGFVCG
ncbi:MAG: hypothetical protein PHD48_09665 [Alphaproteobacteria bacterium]|nr:hypothetical protein [Alphaproteobacteria bacterium]